MLARWQPLDAGQDSISRSTALIISVTQPSHSSLSFGLSVVSLHLFPHSFSPNSLLHSFLFKKEKRANIQRPKMTLNPLKGSTEIIVWKCQPSWCPPPLTLLLSWCLRSLSSLPLVFFQLRGADSPDTIIQLYCGSATVVAALCEGFPRMARGAKPGVTSSWAVDNTATSEGAPRCANSGSNCCHLFSLVNPPGWSRKKGED